MDVEQDFRIYCSDITKSLDTNKARKKGGKNQPLILEGVASTSDIDLEGDFITQQCIENFKLQATNCNIHNNHNVGLDDVIGTVLEVLDSDSKTLRIKFSILPLFREHIEECIDNGVKLGLSIGGTIIDYETGDDGLKINKMMLHEISLTPLPANWNTMGTVVREGDSNVIEAKCLNGVCKQFLNDITKKNIDENIMEKRYYTKEEESHFMSEDRVVELINEALNNFVQDQTPVTEERVAEIIDEKLRGFVEQAKALEKEEEEEKEKMRKQKAKKAKEEEEKQEEMEKLILEKISKEVQDKLDELNKKVKAIEDELEAQEEEEEEEEPETKSRKKSSAKKAQEEEEEEEKEEPVEGEEEEEEEDIEKKGKKSMDSVADLTPEELGSLIAHAVQLTTKSQEPESSVADEIKELKKEFKKEISKAMNSTKQDIEKNLFDGLMKEGRPQSRGDDAQLKKFLKAKSEKDIKKSSTLNVRDIAKTLARDE